MTLRTPDVGFVYDEVFLEHETGSHPENKQRMLATMALLEECGLLGRLMRVPARDATIDELTLVHPRAYVEAMRLASARGGGWVDPDTVITRRSYDVAARVAGGTLAALDAVMRGDVASAFCLVRPPGHHAAPSQAMGFCLLNHVAVAAAYARARHGVERVAIVDYDVHHGNGTQDAFYDEPGVLYISTHEYPFYPGTGAASETGQAAGRGFNVNIPMPHRCGDAEYRQTFESVVLPKLRAYRPQLVLVSAGYDAHFADDIAYEELSVDGYGALVSAIKDAADQLFGGRAVFALEGGYHLTALPWCVRRTIEVLCGDEPLHDPLGTVQTPRPPQFDAMLEEVRRIHGL